MQLHDMAKTEKGNNKDPNDAYSRSFKDVAFKETKTRRTLYVGPLRSRWITGNSWTTL